MAHAGEGSLGAALRGLRMARVLGLNELARRSGASQAALSAWETGSRRPRGPALVRLLDALGADERTKARLLLLADPSHARLALADSPFGPVDVGMVLRVMRERRGVAQADLARRVGVSQAAVSKWESGDAEPSAEAVHAVGFALGASVEETLALASSAGRGEGGLPESPEDAPSHMGPHPGPYALREAVFLGWEAELGRRAARDARWDAPLALALARRAAWLAEEERYAEIAALVRRTVRLAATPEVRFHAVPAIAALADADRQLGRGHGRAAELAGAWAALLPESQNRAWMLRQRGMSLVRMGRAAQGLELVAESAEMDVRVMGMQPARASHLAVLLCEAHLEAGDPRRAATLLDSRRERDFDPTTLVRVEHANGRAAKGSEMAWMRFWAAGEAPSPLKLRRLAEIERRQAWLTGERPTLDNPPPDNPETEDRLGRRSCARTAPEELYLQMDATGAGMIVPETRAALLGADLKVPRLGSGTGFGHESSLHPWHPFAGSCRSPFTFRL